MIDNKSFCAVPFVSIMVNTDTTIRYCCMVKGNVNKLKDYSDPSGKKFYTCKDDFIKEAWNSKDMQDIRKSMIAGEKINGCNVCYLQEESGRTSNRQHSINEWKWRLGEDKFIELINQAKENDGILSNDIVYLDLRLGNLCNLKCRMCNPWNSTQIAKEHIELNERDSDYANLWKKTFGRFPAEVLNDQVWFDSDIMWDQVIDLIPTLKKVYMTGGEPTLIKNNFKFMQACLDRGRTDIVLFFNTNCTNINKKFLELIQQFDQIHINASLDGIGKINDYIRAPSNWNQIKYNIEQLAKMKNVHLGITPTVQIYNIFDLVNIIKWVEYLNIKNNNSIFIDFLINIHPKHLNIIILPDHIKQQALTALLRYKDQKMKKEFHAQMTIDSLEGIIGLLKVTCPDDYLEQLEQFKNYTKILDRERNQTFNDLNDKIIELLK